MSKILCVPGAHPGDIDGKIGTNTNSAIREIKRYLRSEEFPPAKYPRSFFHDDVDDIRKKLENTIYFCANMWTLVFELYQAEIQASLTKDGLSVSRIRGDLKWVDSDKKSVGCGETWPIEARGQDEYKSQANRRVEILIYDPSEISVPLPCKTDKCAEEDCHIFKNIDKYNPGALEKKLKWEYVDLTQDGHLKKGDLLVRFVHTDENPCTREDETWILWSSNDNGATYYSEVPVTDAASVEISAACHIVRFKDVLPDQYYSCYVDFNEDQGGIGIFEDLEVTYKMIFK